MISLAENKHVCCLNAKEGNSFWIFLTANEHPVNGNEVWCYYLHLLQVRDLKSELLSMKGL